MAGMPQKSTVIVSSAKGIQARATRRGVRWTGGWIGVPVNASLIKPSSWSNRHSSRGRQNEAAPPPRACWRRPRRCQRVRNPQSWTTRTEPTANVPPMTSSGGQTASIERKPATVQTSQNGITSERNGKIRPAWRSGYGRQAR